MRKNLGEEKLWRGKTLVRKNFGEPNFGEFGGLSSPKLFLSGYRKQRGVIGKAEVKHRESIGQA